MPERPRSPSRTEAAQEGPLARPARDDRAGFSHRRRARRPHLRTTAAGPLRPAPSSLRRDDDVRGRAALYRDFASPMRLRASIIGGGPTTGASFKRNATANASTRSNDSPPRARRLRQERVQAACQPVRGDASLKPPRSGRPALRPAPLPVWRGMPPRLRGHERSVPSARPTRAHVERILAFGRALPDGARLLVHCMAGISRSTAAALALLVQELSLGRADGAAERLLELRPEAHPNLLIAAHADELLGAGGAVLAAARRIRARNAAIGLSSERSPFR